MVGKMLDWKEELGRWLKPFMDHERGVTFVLLLIAGLFGLVGRALLINR